MTKNNYQILTEYLLDLQKIDSLDKMDAYIEQITNAANEVYPCISCKSGCYTCCTGASMPTVYAREWQRIREYINHQMDSETKEAVINKLNQMIEKHEQLLDFVHGVVQQTATLEDLKKFTKKLVEEFKNESCPLHINGKCSVYPVRPTKCRIFGYFSFVFENKVQILSCESDTIKMHDYLNKQNTKQLALPYWNAFERKLLNFVKDDSEEYQMTVIPLWLKSDLKSAKI